MREGRGQYRQAGPARQAALTLRPGYECLERLVVQDLGMPSKPADLDLALVMTDARNLLALASTGNNLVTMAFYAPPRTPINLIPK